MNRISVQVQPILGARFARVRTFSNETLDNAEWVREINTSLLEGTHLPAEHQTTASVAIVWLFDEHDVLRVIIIDTQDGWQADVSLFVRNNELFSGRGVAATPADAIRAAKLDAYHKAAR